MIFPDFLHFYGKNLGIIERLSTDRTPPQITYVFSNSSPPPPSVYPTKPLSVNIPDIYLPKFPHPKKCIFPYVAKVFVCNIKVLSQVGKSVSASTIPFTAIWFQCHSQRCGRYTGTVKWIKFRRLVLRKSFCSYLFVAFCWLASLTHQRSPKPNSVTLKKQAVRFSETITLNYITIKFFNFSTSCM